MNVSYPPMIGNHARFTENTAMRMRASQKYGTDCRRVDAGMIPSTQVPRRQPTHAPSELPRTKDSTVARPPSTMVHGRA